MLRYLDKGIVLFDNCVLMQIKRLSGADSFEPTSLTLAEFGVTSLSEGAVVTPQWPSQDLLAGEGQ
jgi:hypothetical protein